jgi:hypothetical protein
MDLGDLIDLIESAPVVLGAEEKTPQYRTK